MLLVAAAITGHLEAASRSDKCDSESERLIIVAEKKMAPIISSTLLLSIREGERGHKHRLA